jgi:hypothetical protein
MTGEHDQDRRQGMQTCASELRPEAGDRRLATLVGTLREASVTLDAMWRAAVDRGDAGRLVELGDASYGLHLALVALEDGEADRRAYVS